ncbi:MAG: PDZ domain-containing protein [Proteobacteria bacterium]|nr:PDZ domain-containing protein [Pseudomonadota bacterium]
MSDKNPELESPSPSKSSAPDAPKLKRETIVMVNDRGRLGLLVALCSLAGVAVGFGLSSMASGLYSHHCGARAGFSHMQRTAPASTETPPWLGVRIQTQRVTGGAHVKRVEGNSPARRAGIQPGDVIVGFARSGCPKRVQNIATASDLVRQVQSADVGERVLIMLERDGKSLSLRATLRHMPRGVYYREMARSRRR